MFHKHILFLSSVFVPEEDDNDPEKAARLMKRAARFGHHLGGDAKKRKSEFTLNINNFDVSGQRFKETDIYQHFIVYKEFGVIIAWFCRTLRMRTWI